MASASWYRCVNCSNYFPDYIGLCPYDSGPLTKVKKLDDKIVSAETPEQKARRIGVPVIPPLSEPMRRPDPNPIVAICGACGLECRKVMHYACPRQDCPMQPKPIL